MWWRQARPGLASGVVAPMEQALMALIMRAAKLGLASGVVAPMQGARASRQAGASLG